jgi:hypothetical protein
MSAQGLASACTGQAGDGVRRTKPGRRARRGGRGGAVRMDTAAREAVRASRRGQRRCVEAGPAAACVEAGVSAAERRVGAR